MLLTLNRLYLTSLTAARSDRAEYSYRSFSRLMLLFLALVSCKKMAQRLEHDVMCAAAPFEGVARAIGRTFTRQLTPP